MKSYQVKYQDTHALIYRRCCGRKAKGWQTVLIEANTPEEALRKLRQKVPGASFETVREESS